MIYEYLFNFPNCCCFSAFQAVRDSAVVLACLSQAYKDSPSCRSEAEYAQELKKEIFPLSFDANCKFDGWYDSATLK
jgi:hypothetical protein